MENTIDLLQVKITEAKERLSKETREAIDNVDWKIIIRGMNKKYSPDQLDDLEIETELLLCGILNPDNYQKEIEKRMVLTKEELGLLLEEMDKLIFKKIQSELEKILQRKEKLEKEKKPLILDPIFLNLPKNVQEAISLSNWKENLYEIAKKYKIKIDQMGILEEITIAIMKGEITPSIYEEKIKSNITISKEETPNLILDINNEILIKIRSLLKKQEINKPLIDNDNLLKLNNKDKSEEIPLPPYAKIEEKIKINTEKKDENIVDKPIQDNIENIINIDKIDLIPKIEKPVIPVNIADMMPNVIKNVDIPKKIEISDNSSVKKDPYREEI